MAQYSARGAYSRREEYKRESNREVEAVVYMKTKKKRGGGGSCYVDLCRGSSRAESG
jgi:hypothetical protein